MIITPLSAEAAVDAVELLREAAVWTSKYGFSLWSADDFQPSAYVDRALAGELFGAIEHGRLISCMLLQTSDPIYWPEALAGEALYLHKLAVHRQAAGRNIGLTMINWARSEAARRHVPLLRLDTIASGRLPAYYREIGFRLIEPCEIDGHSMLKMQITSLGS